MYVEQLYTGCLAEAAYYIESNGEAAIIDPIRETEPYLELAAKRNAKIKYIFETHFHADFISGHLDLAAKTGAQIIYGPKADTKYKVYNAKDEETFKLGNVSFKVLHTPGHTPESTCFLLRDEAGKDYAVFTGDTLFVGDVGRPDLLDGVMTKENLAGMMYESLNNKIKTLADEVMVYPGHGAGSSCGKNIGKESFSTIGEQKKFNYALQPMTKSQFVEKITDGIQAPPQYFFKDAMINKNGYESLENVLEQNTKALSVSDFEKAINQGALVIDTRIPDEFEKGFIKNSINIGLNGQFAIWVGTLIDINQPLLLIVENNKEKEAITRLARVGYENVVGYLEGGIESWIGSGKPVEKVESIQATNLKDLQAQGYKLIDVRKPGEYEVAHVKGANHRSLAELPKNLAQLDKAEKYVIHCAGGYRSMIAASMMKKEGFENVVNIYGGFAKIQEAGLPVETEEEVKI